MSKCELDTDCSLISSTVSSPGSSTVSSNLAASSTAPSSLAASTVSSNSNSNPNSNSNSVASTVSSHSGASTVSPPSLPSVNLVHEPSAQIEPNHPTASGPFNTARYLHGHRRMKESLKRLGNYHLREMQCLRGRCMCPSLLQWDGAAHCKEYYETATTNGTHRPHRKNHLLPDLDDELNEDEDEDGSLVSWQTIFLMALGSSLLAGLIFR